MDTGLLLISLLFGSIGLGMFLYGKKSQRLVPLGAGMALMVVPYFVPNLIALILVCIGLSALPLVVRE